VLATLVVQRLVPPGEPPRRADETRSLAQGTGGWAALGDAATN
jgi:hypothetical protein